MSDTVQVSIIVGVVSPTIAALVVWILGRLTRREEWNRQDQVAASVDAAAVAQARQAQDLLDANEANAATSARRFDALDDSQHTIHDLVNSDKTAALIRELQSARRELVSLQEINRLHRHNGDEPSAESLDLIAATVARIEELEQEIQTRKEQQELIEAREVVDAAGVIAAVQRVSEAAVDDVPAAP